MIEVFATGRQYMALRVYPERRENVGVSAMAHGCEVKITSFRAWTMRAIWPVAG